MNSMANFFLAALLFMRLLRMFLKLHSQISLTPGEDKFIIKKNRYPFILP